jgi:hypothetical protein
MTDLDKLREKAQAHHPEPLEDDPFALWCRTCAEDWPCEVWIGAADPSTVKALIDRLQRVETALPILRELALPSSMATDPDGECFFCGGDANEPEDHAGDCLVTLARAALEGGSE